MGLTEAEQRELDQLEYEKLLAEEAALKEAAPDISDLAKVPESMLPSKEVLEAQDAFRAGLLSGATAGHGAQVKAGISSLLGKDYLTERDRIIAETKKLAELNPKSYAAGNIGGAIGTSLIPVGALAKAPLYAKAAAGALSSGLLSMFQNPGDEEGVVSPIQASERVEALKNPGLFLDIPYGGMVEGAALPAAPMLSKPIEAGLRSRAGVAAYKAIDPSVRVVKKQYKKAADIGNEMLESGILDWFPSKEKMLSRLEAKKELTGKNLGEYIDELSPYSEKASHEFDIIRRKKVPVAPQGIAALDAPEVRPSLPGGDMNPQLEYNRALSTDVDLPQIERNRQVGEQIATDLPTKKTSIPGSVSEADQVNPWRIVTELEGDAGPAFSYVDEPFAKGVLDVETRFGTSRKSIANKMRQRLIDRSSNDISTVRDNNRDYERMIREFEGGGKDVLSLAETESKKRDIQKMINFDKQNPASINQTKSAFNEAMRSELMKSGDSLSNYLEKISGKNAGKFEKLKKTHGNIAAATDIAEEGVKKEAAKQMLDGIDKTILGLTAAPVAYEMLRPEDINGVRSERNPIPSILFGLGALGAKKFGSRYGRVGVAKGLDKLRQPVSGTAEFIKNNPWSAQYLLNTLQQDE